MRTMACQSYIFFLLFNIMFSTPMHAQDLFPNLGLPNLGMASAPDPKPVNPGMAPECPAPAPGQLDPGMALAPSPVPLNPGVTSEPSSGPFNMGMTLPPTLAPLNRNCSGNCPVDPFGLAACGLLITGTVTPPTIRLCCSTLSSLTKEDAAACLCNAIEIKAVKIGDLDVTDAMDKALTLCSTPNPVSLIPGMASPSNLIPLNPTDTASAPSSTPLNPGMGLPPIPAPSNNCSRCPLDPVGLATTCGALISGNVSPRTIRPCCKTLSSLTKEDASACLCNVIQLQPVNIGNVDVSQAMDMAFALCSKI